MKNNESMLRLAALLDKAKSKRQINDDIKQLEKIVSTLRLTAVLAKSTSRQQLNQIIRQLEGQVNQIKLQARLDKKTLNANINKTLSEVSFRDIELGINEGAMKLKAQKVISDIRKSIQNIPISVNIASKKERLNNQFTSYLAQNPRIKESDALSKEVNKLRNNIDNVNDDDSLRIAGNSFKLLKNEVAATGYATKSTADKIKSLISGITKISSALGVSSLIINNFQKSLKTIKNNDSILEEISKTTNLSKKQLTELGNESFDIASKFGKLSGDYLLGVQNMVHSGYKATSKEMAELSLLAQSTGNMTTDMANSYILATDNAYKYNGNIQALNAVLNGQNQISKINGITLRNMAEGMVKASAAASNYMVSIEDLSAMIGTIEATSNSDGNETGTAVKDILNNLQNTDSHNITNTLDKANVSMTEIVNGAEKLRNPISIIRDLAKIFNQLNENDPLKAEILTNIGGEYQTEKLAALLQNMDLFDKMLVDYSNGKSSALIQIGQSANSLEGRLNSLTNSWDELVNNITNKPVLKGSISFLDSLLNSATKLIDTFDVIPLALAGITAGMTAKNKDYGLHIFNEKGKFDISGNLLGIDITQIKHFKDAEIAINDWNKQLDNNVTDISSFNNKTVKSTAQLREYLKTCSSEAPASLKGYKASLEAAGIATNSLRLGTILLNAAIGFGLGAVIQGAVTLISDMVHKTDNLRSKAFELGSEFSNTASDIDNYKARILELQDKLNDSGSSIEDVTDARRELMDIQTELIEKYGIEAGGIDTITKAIKGETDALDELKRAKYEEEKQKINEKDLSDYVEDFIKLHEDAAIELRNLLTLTPLNEGKEKPKSNFDEIIDDIEKHSVEIPLTMNANIDKLLESSGFTKTDDSFSFYGSAYEIQDELQRIKDLTSTYDFADTNFADILQEELIYVNELINANGTLYKQFILYDKILSKSADNPYKEQYNSLNEAAKMFNAAKISGNETQLEAASERYSNTLQNAIKIARDNNDSDVANYFENLYPTIQKEVSQWQFKVDFSTNENGIMDEINANLSKLEGSSTDDLLAFNAKTATDKEIEGYGALEKCAQDYNMDIIELIDLLQQLGVVQSENYQELSNRFGEENIKKLTPNELEIAYTIKSTDGMTFEEFQNAIKEEKKAIEEAKLLSFNKSWKDTADETKQELLELARAGEISEETLESTEKYSHLLSETGMSAKRVKDNITDMLTMQEKLSAFSNGMSSLQSAYQEFQDKKFVTASTLEGLPNVLKQMNGGKDFDLFSRIAGDPSSGSQKIKKAFDDIITAYLKNQNTLVGVTQKTKSAVIANLKDAGVSNAAEIVNSYINNVNRGKAIMAQAAAELENKSNAKRQADLNNFQELLLKKDISFAEACNALGGKNAALMQLLGVQYSEDYIKWTQLLSDKISAYNRMVDAINAAGVADDFSNAPYASERAAFEAKYKMSPEEYAAKNNPLNKPFLQRVKQDKGYELAVSIIQNEKAAKKEQKQRDKILNKLNRAKPVDFNGITYNGSSSGDKDGKTQQEKSYQLIDWIARKLETLQSKIDLTKAKFENLFALKSKKDNLSTQIKQTTKLLHKQEKAAKKYQKIANKYAKSNKINKKTIKQVKNGSLNIKKYESKIAEIIQTYQDYYDKAKAAEKAAIEAKKAIRELKKERNQLYIDRADSKLSAIDAQVENQKTVKGKNKYLQKKVEWIKEYYYYQIKNAELEKNETKAAELRAQRKKALRDLEIQQHQNRADDREAHFNLNQKRAENATNAKDKNKYEETSLQNLQDQYRWKAEIAKLEHGEKSAEYKLVKEEEKSEIRAAYKRMYDNIKSEYDNLTSLNDAQIATVQAKIATLEAAGKSASKEMYLEMMKISSDTEEKLINKRAELAESGKNLEAGSDEWYTWKDDMESIEQSLYSCKQNTIEWQKAVNELDLKKFSLMAAQLDATKNHLDFLVGMLSHQDLTSKESGGLTDAGFATISLRFSSIDNQNETIENAREKLKKIYENHLNGTDGLTEEEFLETKEKELDVIRNALEAIADEKDAILDLVDNAMQVQIDSINELIEKKKKALATEKDLYEYQKKVAKQTNNITLIQKQIAALSGDNSEEARAKLQKLQVSLEEAQEDLKDTEYDRWHDDQSDMLDSLSEEVENFWEKMMNDLRKDIDGSMDKLMQMLTDNPEAITRALDSLGLGDALSIITTYNKDGTHTEHSIDYGGTSYESTHQNNTGTNVNNQLDTDPKNPDSPSGGTDSSSGNPENTIRDLASITDEEMKRWMEALLQNKSEEEKKRKQEEEAKKKREEEKKLVYLRAEDIMHDKANGQMNGIAFRGTISAQAERDVIEEFLNSSALHKPTTETGKQRMKTDPLLKYIAEIYSGKTLSNANEALLGAYLGIQVKDKNNVTTKEANKILKAFQKAGFAKGGIASGLNAAVIRNGDDGLITVKRGESILTVEQTERFQKLTDNLDLLNSMTEYAAQIPDYSQMVGCHTVNSPVTVGDVSIHLDGSNVVDKETFRKTLREYDVRSDIEQIALGDISTGTIRNSLKRI